MKFLDLREHKNQLTGTALEVEAEAAGNTV